MTVKQELMKEISQAPDFLAEEVLNFLLFVKNRFQQRTYESQSATITDKIEQVTSESESLLAFIADITSEVPQSEWEKLPSDMSKNIDHYLYGLPKSEE